ncbi:unnamed protein product [Calicophoron daubneyi]|uniref:Tubulin polyglutamylase TTLL7 n=1 Tax=Calicophoron daubneyi TaxID=300641 RepID=A0AAV2TK45_CALDB
MVDKDQIIGYLEESFRQHRGDVKSEHNRKAAKQIRERQKCGVVANLGDSRYELVRKTVQEAGFTIKDDEDLSDAFLVWTDSFLSLEKIMTLKSYQRVNHFPGMIEICRKDFLAKNFMRMNRINPSEYSFMPKTWILPQEHGFFLNYVRRSASHGLKPTFILKPANGAMGHGIRLYRNGETVPTNPPNGAPCVIQEYINNPLLIDGYKCDLRVYVLITSCDPLRIFIYNDGLVRLGAEKYVEPNEPNGASMFMHLTNYAVNKRHAQYQRSSDESVGSKRSFSFLDQFLRNTRRVEPLTVWRNVRDLIVKTVAIAAPALVHSYRMCRPGLHQMNFNYSSEHLGPLTSRKKTGRFGSYSNNTSPNFHRKPLKMPRQNYKSRQPVQKLNKLRSAPYVQSSFFEILGFDILLDDNLKPWLLEVNRSPSFNGDQELDRRVKHGLLTDTLRLLNIRASDKEDSEKAQKMTAVHRLYSHSTSSNISQCDLPEVAQSNKYSSDGATKSHPAGRTEGKFGQKKRPESQYKIDLAIAKLRAQLCAVRRRIALEFYEYHNCGNWCLIFPTDDQGSQKRLASLIISNFAQFHNGKHGELEKELEETYLHPLTEDAILDQLKELARANKKQNDLFAPEEGHGDAWSEDVESYDSDESRITSGDEGNCGEQNCAYQNRREGKYFSHTLRNHSVCRARSAFPLQALLSLLNVMIDTKDLNEPKLRLSKGAILEIPPKQLCTIPLMHCTVSSGLTQFQKVCLERKFSERMTLAKYYPCVKKLARNLALQKLYKFELVDSKAVGRELAQYLCSLCEKIRDEQVFRKPLILAEKLARTCFHPIFALLDVKGYVFPPVASLQAHTNELLRGLRIIRMLHRIHNRLVMNHAVVFREILNDLDSICPRAQLLTEPLLGAEQRCCDHYLRLCIEAGWVDFSESVKPKNSSPSLPDLLQL